jgi:putative SbcD/Mre11-related phosphoesterase
MDRSQFELEPGLWLDAGRAVWLPEPGVLIVADLHLGYAWAHRADGQLLPISAKEDTTERLLALLNRYPARELVLLGDILHRAVHAPALYTELRWLVLNVGERTRLRLIGGNHDRDLAATLATAGLALEIDESLSVGPHLLLHGDGKDDVLANARLRECRQRSGRVILGHEHPSIVLSDGVASRAKCPCFLSGPGILVLPAFSAWAAGSPVQDESFLSPYAQASRFDRAVAVLAGKLLPVPISCTGEKNRA